MVVRRRENKETHIELLQMPSSTKSLMKVMRSQSKKKKIGARKEVRVKADEKATRNRDHREARGKEV